MGGCRCSYKNCTNTTKTRDNLHFFHYPVKQKDRCRQWIENANKPQFYDLDEDQLRNKVICETHFEDCYFPNMQKKRLLQGAIPTLEGDCEPKPEKSSIKIHDVQVLPANADGTIFVLETNMQHSFQSEKVESYIYTNNGLVLPISKCNEGTEDSIQTMFSEGEIDEMKRDNESPEMFTTVAQPMKGDNDFVYVEDTPVSTPEKVNNSYDKMKLAQKAMQVQEQKSPQTVKMTEEIFSKSVENKYVKKIKQHSKDIAILKRILKSKRPCRRPNNNVILNTLKKQLPSSLIGLLTLNLCGKCELSPEDKDLFSTIYSTSPQLYDILTEKYKWRLPNPEMFNTKNNGHV